LDQEQAVREAIYLQEVEAEKTVAMLARRERLLMIGVLFCDPKPSVKEFAINNSLSDLGPHQTLAGF